MKMINNSRWRCRWYYYWWGFGWLIWWFFEYICWSKVVFLLEICY